LFSPCWDFTAAAATRSSKRVHRVHHGASPRPRPRSRDRSTAARSHAAADPPRHAVLPLALPDCPRGAGSGRGVAGGRAGAQSRRLIPAAPPRPSPPCSPRVGDSAGRCLQRAGPRGRCSGKRPDRGAGTGTRPGGRQAGRGRCRGFGDSGSSYGDARTGQKTPRPEPFPVTPPAGTLLQEPGVPPSDAAWGCGTPASPPMMPCGAVWGCGTPPVMPHGDVGPWRVPPVTPREAVGPWHPPDDAMWSWGAWCPPQWCHVGLWDISVPPSDAVWGWAAWRPPDDAMWGWGAPCPLWQHHMGLGSPVSPLMTPCGAGDPGVPPDDATRGCGTPEPGELPSPAGRAGEALHGALNPSNLPCAAQPRSPSPLAFNYTLPQPLVLSPSITPTLSRSGRQRDAGGRVKGFGGSSRRKAAASDGKVASPWRSRSSGRSRSRSSSEASRDAEEDEWQGEDPGCRVPWCHESPQLRLPPPRSSVYTAEALWGAGSSAERGRGSDRATYSAIIQLFFL